MPQQLSREKVLFCSCFYQFSFKTNDCEENKPKLSNLRRKCAQWCPVWQLLCYIFCIIKALSKIPVVFSQMCKPNISLPVLTPLLGFVFCQQPLMLFIWRIPSALPNCFLCPLLAEDEN